MPQKYQPFTRYLSVVILNPSPLLLPNKPLPKRRYNYLLGCRCRLDLIGWIHGLSSRSSSLRRLGVSIRNGTWVSGRVVNDSPRFSSILLLPFGRLGEFGIMPWALITQSASTRTIASA